MAVKSPRRQLGKSESGQAVVEYILILFVVISAYVMLAGWMTRSGFAKKLTKPITGDFAKAYQFGDIKAEGFENGSPKRHPRVTVGEENFRIFINPDIK